MYYITVMQPPRYKQMTIEEYLFQTVDESEPVAKNITNTLTYERERVSQRFRDSVDVGKLIRELHEFNERNAGLFAVEDRHALYRSFSIPKKTGGLRKINAPNETLMTALRDLKAMFETDFHALYHTSAFAYVKGRSTVDAVSRHQRNQSKWFGKFDFHDFFGSTTKQFVMKMFAMIFPFSEVLEDDEGRAELERALDLAFLDGGLPQGTPISPLITNVMMIPIDFRLSNTLRDFEKQSYVFTRYADDTIVSSQYDFNIGKIEQLIKDTLKEFDAPFSINEKKTRYGSSAGRNWNLGIMLNKDNEMTVGHKNKKRLQSMLHNYVTDRNAGVRWEKGDIQEMQGQISYYRMVEQDNIDAIIRHFNEKHGVDVMGLIKADLKTL